MTIVGIDIGYSGCRVTYFHNDQRQTLTTCEGRREFPVTLQTRPKQPAKPYALVHSRVTDAGDDPLRVNLKTQLSTCADCYPALLALFDLVRRRLCEVLGTSEPYLECVVSVPLHWSDPQVYQITRTLEMSGFVLLRVVRDTVARFVAIQQMYVPPNAVPRSKLALSDISEGRESSVPTRRDDTGGDDDRSGSSSGSDSGSSIGSDSSSGSGSDEDNRASYLQLSDTSSDYEDADADMGAQVAVLLVDVGFHCMQYSLLDCRTLRFVRAGTSRHVGGRVFDRALRDLGVPATDIESVKHVLSTNVSAVDSTGRRHVRRNMETHHGVQDALQHVRSTLSSTELSSYAEVHVEVSGGTGRVPCIYQCIQQSVGIQSHRRTRQCDEQVSIGCLRIAAACSPRTSSLRPIHMDTRPLVYTFVLDSDSREVSRQTRMIADDGREVDMLLTVQRSSRPGRDRLVIQSGAHQAYSIAPLHDAQMQFRVRCRVTHESLLLVHSVEEGSSSGEDVAGTASGMARDECVVTNLYQLGASRLTELQQRHAENRARQQYEEDWDDAYNLLQDYVISARNAGRNMHDVEVLLDSYTVDNTAMSVLTNAIQQFEEHGQSKTTLQLNPRT